MSYLLDTCVISEFRKTRCNHGVSSWFSSVEPEECFLSVLTIGEIRRGIELMRVKDAKSAAIIERWLFETEAHYAERILPITAEIADQWGRLSLNQPLPAPDALMAATAIRHRLTMVTRNIADFQRSGVSLINPFS